MYNFNAKLPKEARFFCFPLVWNGVSLLHLHGNTLHFTNTQKYSISRIWKPYIPSSHHNMLLHQLFHFHELIHHICSSVPLNLPIRLTRVSQTRLYWHCELYNSLLWGVVLYVVNVFSRIPGLYPLDGNSTTPSPSPQQLQKPKIAPHFLMSPKSKITLVENH